MVFSALLKSHQGHTGQAYSLEKCILKQQHHLHQMQLCTQYIPVGMLCFSVSIRGRGHQLESTKATFIQPMHSLPRSDIPFHMVTCPLKPDCFVTYCQQRTFYLSLIARHIALISRLFRVRLLMRPLTIHRLRSLLAVLNGCCLASLLKSLSSFGIVFRGFSVLWRSFTLPVWVTRCFNRTMTELITLNRSAVCLQDIPPLTMPTACHLCASDSFQCAMLN